MPGLTDVLYVHDADGKNIGVIVPIELWRKIESARVTAYLLSSEAMRRRLAEAKDRADGITIEDACTRLGA